MEPGPADATAQSPLSRSQAAGRLSIAGSRNNLIRHDYKRAVYRAFLAEFTPKTVREYFEKAPLEIEGVPVRGSALYELLWRRKAQVPAQWEQETDSFLEEFILAQGRDPRKMMSKILGVNGGSAPIPGKTILAWFYPKLEALLTQVDTREICFGLITLVTEKWVPGRIHRRVMRREKEGWIENILVFIDDADHANFLDWDYEFIAGPQIIEAPLKLGLPPFERFAMLADTRPPERILREPGDEPAWEGGRMFIRGVEYGTLTTFHEHLRSIELDLTRFHPPDMEVVRVERDYVCPWRKRVVLHSGCVYGAPFFVSRTEHRKLAGRKEYLLSPLISDIEREEQEEESDSLLAKHQALLATLRDAVVFSYHTEDESLSLNGKHFAKGIPAKIMRSLLQSYLRTGRTDFEYREFKRDFEISLGQKNANFEVRFYRLMEKVAEQGGAIRIEKTGRGAFRLHVEVEVRLEDPESTEESAGG